jgi:hypothetical protein
MMMRCGEVCAGGRAGPGRTRQDAGCCSAARVQAGADAGLRGRMYRSGTGSPRRAATRAVRCSAAGVVPAGGPGIFLTPSKMVNEWANLHL